MKEKKETAPLEVVPKTEAVEEPKVMSKEDLAYLSKLQNEFAHYTQEISKLELMKHSAIGQVERLQQGEREFIDQVYEKYEIDRNMNINLDPESGVISLSPKEAPTP